MKSHSRKKTMAENKAMPSTIQVKNRRVSLAMLRGSRRRIKEVDREITKETTRKWRM
jgi:hypothetical protein